MNDVEAAMARARRRYGSGKILVEDLTNYVDVSRKKIGLLHRVRFNNGFSIFHLCVSMCRPSISGPSLWVRRRKTLPSSSTRDRQICGYHPPTAPTAISLAVMKSRPIIWNNICPTVQKMALILIWKTNNNLYILLRRESQHVQRVEFRNVQTERNGI